MPKILAFSGSARNGSFNQQLVAIAAQGAKQAGVETTLISLGDFSMPLYYQEIEEQGFPDEVRRFKTLLKAYDALLIASPEYNSAYSPLLKNAIDWASRPEGDEPMLAAFSGKCAGIMAASPGALGGMRGLVPLRMLLENIGVMVLPNQKAIPSAHEAFDASGNLRDDKNQQSIMQIGIDLAEVVKKLRN